MSKTLSAILSSLFSDDSSKASGSILDPSLQFNEDVTDHAGILRSINAAFLIALSGQHPLNSNAKSYLERMSQSPDFKVVASFYAQGLFLVHQEIDTVAAKDPLFSKTINDLEAWLSRQEHLFDIYDLAEKTWPVFFPEASGLIPEWDECVEVLRQKRTVSISRLNPNPLKDPGEEILFTSNALLTIPVSQAMTDTCSLPEDMKHKISSAACENQAYWYDHPIPVGIPGRHNEVLHGLRGLDDAVAFEKTLGNFTGERITCVLSVSVTHKGLHEIAKPYIEEELRSLGGLNNVDVYIITETDAERLVNEILSVFAKHSLALPHAQNVLKVFGVDGEYGRHYSFLKAVSALWNTFIDPAIKATFKIDLDQVFDQDRLLEETGASAFEHFKTPLWGAQGIDTEGKPVELGMIAGALVNNADIEKSLFTADVTRPQQALKADEFFFFSALPQALSTQAEMMTRYDTKDLDGEHACIERVHVTGGTNGILVESLVRHRPFTPSFIGRAEDQAYILSVSANKDARLAYLHKDGLIMRHDKDVFARDAIDAAYVGKLIGDYIRILHFSAYAGTLTDDISLLKKLADPFTGCFISKIPFTVVYLRFALKAASMLSQENPSTGVEFIRTGTVRIQSALNFTLGTQSPLARQYEKEKKSWDLYYDILAEASKALHNNDPLANELRLKARKIINSCHISTSNENLKSKH